CPYCSWIQKNRRAPDFKRHLKTHTRSAADRERKGYVCKGYEVGSEKGRGLMQGDGTDVVLVLGEGGEERVGGCGKSFSRGDALKRHLDNPNIPCVG
ncbi:hypothetical protein BDV98DRAFT_471065, partial [Pterulicium gracile]